MDRIGSSSFYTAFSRANTCNKNDFTDKNDSTDDSMEDVEVTLNDDTQGVLVAKLAALNVSEEIPIEMDMPFAVGHEQVYLILATFRDLD